MRVLFFMRSTVYVRNFESTLRLLAERGHAVHVVARRHSHLDPSDLMGRLGAEFPGITHEQPPAAGTEWTAFGFELRRALDYLRYLEPEYQDAPKLRYRAETKSPAFLGWPGPRGLVATAAGRRRLARVIDRIDRALPHDPALEAFIARQRPDLVLVTPLVEPGSPQSEYLRAARAAGVRTGLCVYSWDNLTNKGLIHDPLDVVTVWNEAMKAEAITLHGMPADRVVVTGAPAYDHWFTWTPHSSRGEFCARVGLEGCGPYMLYLCSSRFIAPDELPFVRRWVQQLRAASDTLRQIGIVIRPHPQNNDVWRDADLSDLGNVVVWPRAGSNPVDAASRADYFDSIAHSAAVVGVNTSAQIESAIVGRGVFTLLAPEFRETQEGTLHFRHLRDVNGGLLHVASSIEEHVAQLETAIANPQLAAEKCRRFIDAFVRPYGVDQPAAPRLVAALEAAASGPAPRPVEQPRWRALARPLLYRTAAAVVNAERRRGWKYVKPLEQRRAARASKKEKRTAVLARRASDPFERYLQVRDHVRRMQSADDAAAMTAVEQQRLAAIAHLWDADAGTIADLREYSKVITGVRRSHYKGPRADGLKNNLERDLERLLDRGDAALLVDEPHALGGFGFDGFGKRYNEDTLRFYRVVSLLQDAALMKDLRDQSRRPTVWEIGGGWGGFGYQFKTLCPDVTYLITGAPDLFLVSAVDPNTVFPAARMRFFDPADPEAFWRDWGSVDFAFAPERIVPAMRPPALDLTLDVMTLEHQDQRRVERHVQRAHDLNCRYFFSVCPVGEPDPAVAIPVAPSVERWYWRHPVSTPSGLTKRLALGPPKRGAIAHTYLLGWRRLHV